MLEVLLDQQSILRNCDQQLGKQIEIVKNDPNVLDWAKEIGIRYALEWITEVSFGLTEYNEGPSLGGVCSGCKTVGIPFQIHHHGVPRRDNGEMSVENCLLLCNECHTRIEPSRQ